MTAFTKAFTDVVRRSGDRVRSSVHVGGHPEAVTPVTWTGGHLWAVSGHRSGKAFTRTGGQ